MRCRQGLWIITSNLKESAVCCFSKALFIKLAMKPLIEGNETPHGRTILVHSDVKMLKVHHAICASVIMIVQYLELDQTYSAKLGITQNLNPVTFSLSDL